MSNDVKKIWKKSLDNPKNAIIGQEEKKQKLFRNKFVYFKDDVMKLLDVLLVLQGKWK